MKMVPAEADNYQSGDKNFDGGKGGGKALGTKLFEEIYGRDFGRNGGASATDKWNNADGSTTLENQAIGKIKKIPNQSYDSGFDFDNKGKLKFDKDGDHIKIDMIDKYNGRSKLDPDMIVKPKPDPDMIVKFKSDKLEAEMGGKPNPRKDEVDMIGKPNTQKQDSELEGVHGEGKPKVRDGYLDLPVLPEFGDKCGERDKCFNAPREQDTGKPTGEVAREKPPIDDSRLQNNGDRYTDERGRLVQRTPFGVVVLEDGLKPLDSGASATK